jgi:hypothetical protein
VAGRISGEGPTFYSVSDANYFVGTAGMVNSLRVTGHGGEIVILDCGLTDEQRGLLARECTVLPRAGRETDGDPDSNDGPFRMEYKLLAPRSRPSDLTVMIDSDMIVTGRLDGLVDAAAAGRVAGYADPESDRWFAEWQDIYGLPNEPRHDPYVCAGLVVFSQASQPELLDRWWAACRSDRALTPTDGARAAVAQHDQDALNAVLMAWYREGTVDLRPAHEAPQAHELRLGVTVHDLRTLQCSYRGQPTRLLHSAGRPKPWVRVGARKTAYTDLLRRLVTWGDVPIQAPPHLVPRWLRDGRMPGAYRGILDLYSRSRASISRRAWFFPPRLRRQVSRMLP